MTQVFRQIYAPTYDVLNREKNYAGEIGGRIIEATKECHAMRSVSFEEITWFPAIFGLRLLRLGAFPAFDREPDHTTGMSWR